MIKYCYYQINKKISVSLFKECLNSIEIPIDYLNIENETSGIIGVTDDLIVKLNYSLEAIARDLNVIIHKLITFKINDSYKEILKYQIDYDLGETKNLGEMFAFYLKDNVFKNIICLDFAKVENCLLEDIYIYICDNFNTSRAANDLYLHRNTLLYRINKFISLTDLDIRNSDNGLYFLAYYHKYR
ncbi:MAG: helix-turn-helix domain-containing protein [Bacilli bacterium]|nr:helix-turn-helix domain-containing protein [Bacilli bacterium]